MSQITQVVHYDPLYGRPKRFRKSSRLNQLIRMANPDITADLIKEMDIHFGKPLKVKRKKLAASQGRKYAISSIPMGTSNGGKMKGTMKLYYDRLDLRDLIFGAGVRDMMVSTPVWDDYKDIDSMVTAVNHLFPQHFEKYKHHSSSVIASANDVSDGFLHYHDFRLDFYDTNSSQFVLTADEDSTDIEGHVYCRVVDRVMYVASRFQLLEDL